MNSTIARLALFQCLAVFYSVLVVGLVLKVRFGSPAPQIFATHLRDYGLLLLLLPVAWTIWASLSANRPIPGVGEFGPMLSSGLVLLGLLFVIAFIGTASASFPMHIVHLIATPAVEAGEAR